MRIFLLFLFFLTVPCQASERIRMTQEFSGEREASELLDSVASAASSGDFNGFIKCFTGKYASGIRRKMKPVISGCDIEMEILDNKVESCDENSIKMRARYSWDNGTEKTMFVSDVVAKMEAGSWKIDSESIVSAKKVNRNPPTELNFGGGGQVAFANAEDLLPLDIARTKGGGCAGGRCVVIQPQATQETPATQEPPVANQALPMPSFDVLPLDISKRPGGGCAGGRCRL
ncbi:hypothetical protein EBT16_00865 [bacterium]|nr:hypothetical protein [bacterium]